MKNPLVKLTELHRFDSVIDVRTPLEFQHDHLPGAINAPVLSNEERVTIGTMYKQVSAFEATRLGAAMVARNIALHLETLFAEQPKHWTPLVYCWRGGKRSGAMTAWMNLIGWKARQLEGGYKAYRHWTLEQLETLPGQFAYTVICGPTGSGKTRLLTALRAIGTQVLDLEELARHRGSLLGALPDCAQPSQKQFESAIVEQLARFDRQRPVFVEAESRMIGNLRLPLALLEAMHAAPCIELTVDLDARIAFLCQDYAHLFDDRERFKEKLGYLAPLHGKKTLAGWLDMIDQGDMAGLFKALVTQHYDPAYQRSSHSHYRHLAEAQRRPFDPVGDDLSRQAQQFLATLSQ